MLPLLAVIPFTGSERLVSMTAAMLSSLRPTLKGHDVTIRLVANKPWRLLTETELGGAEQISLDSNVGFGPGCNAAVKGWDGDVLVMNNDLTFPQLDWLTKMREQQVYDEISGLSFVYAPRTTVTATWQACAETAEDKPAQRIGQVSAYCWLIPAKMRARLRERVGFELFPPAPYHNYGSDDVAGAWLRKLFGSTPFMIVHRAFCVHAKGQTAKETGDKAGDKELLKRMRAYLRGHQLSWRAF